MRVLYERCCGLDMHKQVVVACLLPTEPEATVHKEVRTYRTMTNDLLALADWLRGGALRAGGDGVDGLVLATGLHPAGGAV